MQLTKVFIEGMSCNHCVMHVKKALEAINGISNVAVYLDGKCATYGGTIDEDLVRAAIDDAGYEATGFEKAN